MQKKCEAAKLRLFGLGVLLLLVAGCAQQRARHHLEGVAKGWCETIRASQVIPVYPLTEDLLPGDVFMVQTTVGAQASLYRQKGFLALDDRRTRLGGINYSNAYFDGYWKDEFGKGPHERGRRAAAAAGNTEVGAPRAAFPSYTFAARSGFGLSSAFPIQGIPVGLNFLRTDDVRGSVTISDARTYAANELELYKLLQSWTQDDAAHQILSETVRRSGSRPVFLRVVTRVYLTGGVVVSLTRSDASGAGLNVGKAPHVSMIETNGTVNQNYEQVLRALNNTNSGVGTSAKDVGVGVKFVSASDSSVSLSENFDRMLVIGYLGFDVQVLPNGEIGVPIPTFQILNGHAAEPSTSTAGPLTLEQARFKVSESALQDLAVHNKRRAIATMKDIVRAIDSSEFAEARAALKSLPSDTIQREAALGGVLGIFKAAAIEYVSGSGQSGIRYTRYDEVFCRAYERSSSSDK